MKSFYRITVPKFGSHNKGIRKAHKKTLISNGFCDDAKLLTLPLSVRWLFLGIVLTCGNHTSDTVEIGEKRLREMLESSWSIPRALDSLQELQLLKYDKIQTLYEIKVKERKGKESNSQRGQRSETAAPPAVAKAPAPNGGILIAFYCDSWKIRYKAEKSPTVLPHHAKQMKTLLTEVGLERAKILVGAYLSMPDSWFVTKRHDIPTMMGNLNAVTQFADSGKMISRRETQQMDLAVSSHNTLDAIRRGEV